MHERTLPFEDSGHIRAERLRTDQNQSEEQCNLEDSNASHEFLLKPLRAEKSVNQIDKKAERSKAGNNVIHGHVS
jgi:hypothetical protein